VLFATFYKITTQIINTLSQKRPAFYILKNSAQSEPIQIIFGGESQRNFP